MHVQPVHGRAVRGQGHESGGGRGDVQVVDQDTDPAPERRGRADHALGLVEHDPGLITAGGGGVDLGALLAVGDQQIEADPGGEGALAVLSRNGAVGCAEAPETIGALPAKEAADHERLPGRKREALPRPFALGVAQEAEEGDCMLRRLRIEVQTSRARRGEILEVARAGQVDEVVGEDMPVGYGARVGADRVILRSCSSHGRAGTPRTDPRAASRRRGSAYARTASCRIRMRSGP
jgi:hypothetical protein